MRKQKWQINEIVVKALDGQRYPLPVCGCEVVRGAAAPKGPMTYASAVSVIAKGGVWV